MYINHLFLANFLTLQQLSYKNYVVKYQHLQHKLQHLLYNGHYLAITLKRQSNLDIHHLSQSHLLPPVFEPTSKSLTTNLNQREILFLLILLLVPQVLPATQLPLRHLHSSDAKLLAKMKVRKLQSLTISHILVATGNRLNATLRTDSRDL